MRKIKSLCILIAIVIYATPSFSQTPKVTKHENVVYGMISGMALLMDIYQPANSNHIGIVYVVGSGWGYPNDYQKVYNQVPLKDDYFLDPEYTGKWIKSLTEKGYTVFVINHRFAPRFHFPDIFYDCQRAVRFIRYNAKKYGIDANKIGAMGHSSGANLSGMLGVTDTAIVKPENGIDSMSSKVQAVVALAPPFVLSERNMIPDTALANFYMRAVQNYVGDLSNYQNAVSIDKASPISYVTNDDAPFLIYYSEDDPIVPAKQTELMCKKLKETRVPFKEFKKTNEGHNPIPDMKEVDSWFRKYLK